VQLHNVYITILALSKFPHVTLLNDDYEANYYCIDGIDGIDGIGES
jgi:hypothetical protein